MSETAQKTRFIKTVRTTYTDLKRELVDEKVNHATKLIAEHGGKIVSIFQYTFGVGMSTVYSVYNITYEATEAIPKEVFSGKDNR